ncbi:MAG: phosphoribosyltransferase family protein, partial [bacterium]
PEVSGRHVVLVDDGLASGYTMHAAVAWVKERGCRTVTVAAPTAHLSTAARLARSSDHLVCPNIRGGMSFAVAEAYEHWYDLSDDDVLNILEEMEKG